MILRIENAFSASLSRSPLRASDFSNHSRLATVAGLDGPGRGGPAGEELPNGAHGLERGSGATEDRGVGLRDRQLGYTRTCPKAEL